MSILGECDSCLAHPRLLRTILSYAGEGSFCSECRHQSLADDIGDLEDMLDEERTDKARADIEAALAEARENA